jgi:hypothetical protein
MEDGASGCVLSIPLAVAGEAFAFVTLDDGSLIIEDQQGEESLEQVATVVERRIERPYRARGFRLDDSRWLVVADPLELLDCGAFTGEDVTLVAVAGERRLIVDDVLRPPADIPEELAAEADESDPCIISASHVDDAWWEVTVEELPRQIGSVPPLPTTHADEPDEDAEDAEETDEEEPDAATAGGPPPVAPLPPLAAPGPQRATPGAWTFTAKTDAPGLTGEAVELVVANAGTVVVLGQEQPAGLLVPLRTAIEAKLAPPYRAQAQRESGDTWTVNARPARIERFTHAGEELELTHHGGVSSLVVDGEARPGTVPRLEVVGLTVGGASYVARATHLRDDLWDVRVDPA